MFFMDILIPLAMGLLGRRFGSRPPEKINRFYGYRTEMSMKNQETWEFAHRHIGRLWQIISIPMMPLSPMPLLFVMGKGDDVIGITGTVVVVLELVVVFLTIASTERALAGTFDKDGRRR